MSGIDEICIEDFVNDGKVNITKSDFKKLRKFPDPKKQIAEGIQYLVNTKKVKYP